MMRPRVVRRKKSSQMPVETLVRNFWSTKFQPLVKTGLVAPFLAELLEHDLYRLYSTFFFFFDRRVSLRVVLSLACCRQGYDLAIAGSYQHVIVRSSLEQELSTHMLPPAVVDHSRTLRCPMPGQVRPARLRRGLSDHVLADSLAFMMYKGWCSYGVGSRSRYIGVCIIALQNRDTARNRPEATIVNIQHSHPMEAVQGTTTSTSSYCAIRYFVMKGNIGLHGADQSMPCVEDPHPVVVDVQARASVSR